jgi:hypothetical protein
MKPLRFSLRWLVVVFGGCLLVVAAGCSSGTPLSPSAQTTAGSDVSRSTTANGGGGTTFVDANGVDLKGDWVSTERQSRGLDGPHGGSETITVTEQNGALFVVARDLELSIERPLGDGGPPTKQVTGHPLLGVVNVDGSITMVKKGDAGQMNGRLTDMNTMVLSYAEPGDEPGVSRVTLVRDASGSTAGTTPGSASDR